MLSYCINNVDAKFNNINKPNGNKRMVPECFTLNNYDN